MKPTYGLATLTAVLLASTGCGGADLPKAADGSDLTKCSDGACEVLVTPHTVIRPASRFGIGQLTVTAIGDKTITVSGSGKGTQLEGTGPVDFPISLNGLKITPEGIKDQKAVIKIAPS